jgi:Fic family protein
MLYSVPDLDADDTRVIAEIDESRQRLRHHLRAPVRWQGHLRRGLVARAIQGSNTIEGYTVSIADAEALVGGDEMSTEVAEDTRAAVAGYRDALTWVQQSADMDNFSYHEMLFSTLHFMMLKADLGRWPGRYRPCEIFVTGSRPYEPVVYAGPDPERVPALMAELVEWLNTADPEAPALVRAAMAHLNLVSIHPWRDGNGRMSRCLHTLILARERVLAPEFSSIEEWLGDEHNTVRYYDALRDVQQGGWQPERNAHSWVRFCLRAHHMQAQLVQRRVDVAARIWGAMAGIAESNGLDERVVTALYEAATGRLSRTTYQRDEGLTRDQAVRDLQALKRLDLLDSVGHSRTQHYTAAGEARDRASAIFGDLLGSALRDPYRDPAP